MHIKLLCTPLLMVLRFQTLVTNSSCHAFDRWQEWPRVTVQIRGSSLHIPSWNSKWSEMDGVRGIKFCSVPAQRTGAPVLLIQLAWAVRSVQRWGNLRWMASTVTAYGWRTAAFGIFSLTMGIALNANQSVSNTVSNTAKHTRDTSERTHLFVLPLLLRNLQIFVWVWNGFYTSVPKISIAYSVHCMEI